MSPLLVFYLMSPLLVFYPDNVFLSHICPLFFPFSFAFKLISLVSKVRCDTQAHPAPPIVVEQG